MPQNNVFSQWLRHRYIRFRFDWEHFCLTLRFLHTEWNEAHQGWNWLIGTAMFKNRLDFIIENYRVIEPRVLKEARRTMLRKKICRADELPSMKQIEEWFAEPPIKTNFDGVI